MSKEIAISEINFSSNDMTKIRQIRQYIKLYEAIKNEGIKEPIVLSKDYVVLNGLGRIAVAKELNVVTLPYLKNDEDPMNEIEKYL